MVNGKRLGSQGITGFPFTVYCLPEAMRLALCSMLVLWPWCFCAELMGPVINGILLG
jgi:hypothetical protein